MKKNSFTLYYQTWKKCSKEQKKFFVDLFDQDVQKAQAFYERFFLMFHIIHECAHALRSTYGIKTARYEDEKAVNIFAVAFFRYINKTMFLNLIEEDIKEMISIIEKPSIGEDEETYFNREYNTISRQPKIYGFFQLHLVKIAFREKKSLDRILCNVTGKSIKKVQSMKQYRLPRNSPRKMVKLFTSILEELGVSAPSIKVRNTYNASIQYITSRN